MSEDRRVIELGIYNSDWLYIEADRTASPDSNIVDGWLWKLRLKKEGVTLAKGWIAGELTTQKVLCDAIHMLSDLTTRIALWAYNDACRRDV